MDNISFDPNFRPFAFENLGLNIKRSHISIDKEDTSVAIGYHAERFSSHEQDHNNAKFGYGVDN